MSLLIRLPWFAALLLGTASITATPLPPSNEDWAIADPATHGLDAARFSALDAAVNSDLVLEVCARRMHGIARTREI